MAACPCCGAGLTGYERIAAFGKGSLRTGIVLCCRYCRWQGACRENCPDDLPWG
ncbi:MAG: hypothetical protein PWR25_1210 [Euryarchaeota archaeon]|uniref:hypothetical protein n=1 Tax=unclassified Methanoculleus TaxID=2619537 RepID=UPI0025EB5D77|nr:MULTISPECIES: hypothetical protein [unclassified Methanoculleus]MDK2916653.1 hypothetical protein [Euryarchaeota archaeon]